MALLAVQQQGATITLDGESARVLACGGAVLAHKPLFEIDEVHLYGELELTAKLRSELLKRGVDVLLLSRAGTFRGRLSGPEPPWALRRMSQYRTLGSSEQALALARFVVGEKLHNQRALLQRAAREHPEAAAPGSLASLRQMIARAERAGSMDELRGVEGLGAVMYFRGLSAAVRDPSFRFEGRTKRPPLDPFNACLSFGYTLLLRRVEAALMRAGLDVSLGALHESSRGRPSLALDLMEPYRPVVDRLVLRLVNTRQLDVAAFVRPGGSVESVAEPLPEQERDTEKGVHLGPECRAIFIRAWAQLWRTRFGFGEKSERHELEAILQRQAFQLGKGFEEGKVAPLAFRLR